VVFLFPCAIISYAANKMDSIFNFSFWKRSFVELLFSAILKVVFVWKVGSVFVKKIVRMCMWIFNIYYFIVPR